MWPTFLKACSGCGQTFESSEFNLDSYQPDGLRIYCKACDRAVQRAVYARSPRRGRLARGRVCSVCREFKNLSEFSPHRGHSLGVQSYCKACNCVRQRRRRENQNQDLRAGVC